MPINVLQLRDKSMKARVIIAIALAAIALVFFFKLHFIKYTGGGGDVLWKDDEAYLFMYDRHSATA
jgi:hypothetical protein